jgi:hypothetical protein
MFIQRVGLKLISIVIQLLGNTVIVVIGIFGRISVRIKVTLLKGFLIMIKLVLIAISWQWIYIGKGKSIVGREGMWRDEK